MDKFAEILYYVTKTCGTDWKLTSHIIDFHDLIFIKSGSVLYKINDCEINAKQGEALYLPPGSIRAATTEGMECTAFNFRTFPQNEPLPLENHFTFDYKSFSVLPVIFEELWQSTNIRNSNFAANGIFMQILSKLLEENLTAYKNIHIQKAESFINQNLFDDLNLEKIAGYCALSPVYTGALFKCETGKTVKQYINSKRIDAAVKLLIYENYSVGEAAVSCGFDNIYYFSRIFKQIKGVSPKEYKQKYIYSNSLVQ